MADSILPVGEAAAVQQIEVVNRRGLGLVAQFAWVDDRFRHTIGMFAPGTPQNAAPQVLLASDSADGDAGGGDSEAWPADPPLQQLSVEPIGADASDAVLAVGQAGCGHWSSSVEAILRDEQPTLKFDIACRFSKPADYLGSQYRLADPRLSLQPQGENLLLALADHRLQLAAVAPATAAVEATALAWQLDAEGQRLRLSVPDTGGSTPRTVRWQFTITLS
ncbi:hypothetical protein [Roseimaritima ulvae]|uniref:Uncharacterized protein n=1 Tax=Roseimaritima ulvae TaxID=980254 RepID=A0A5B9QHW5_9BACT|nr:hypothetical protein [Roseimaritima ulvae]QEG38717.1 hypothetical protein UC8_06750 [Roseimaritima ulvae]